MRYDIAASTNTRVEPTQIFHEKRVSHLKIQIFDPVTVFFSVRREDFSTVDAAGNPTKGFQFGQGIYDLWYVSGELWATCNQSTSIEVQAWPLGGVS